MKPVRARPFGEDTADRIGQRGNGFQSGGNRLDAFRVERQPIAQRGGEALRSGLREVAGIGREDVRFAGSDRRRSILQRRDLGIGGSKAERNGSLAGAPPDLGHFGVQIRPRSRRRVANKRLDRHRGSVTTRSSR